MFIKRNEIELSGKKMPIAMCIPVMSAIQSIYGSLTEFELKLMGWELNEEGKVIQKGEPSCEVIEQVLPMMIEYGYISEEKECPYSNEEILLMIDKKPLTIALAIHEELMIAMETKKKTVTPRQKQRKNAAE